MSQTSQHPRDISWSEPSKGDRAGAGTPEPVDPLAELVTLRQAVDRGLVHGAYEAARKRLQRARRDGNGPEPRGKDGNADLFRVGDLVEWTESELVS